MVGRYLSTAKAIEGVFMSKSADDFQVAKTPFEISLKDIAEEWTSRAVKINGGSHADGIARDAAPFVNVVLPQEDDDEDDEGFSILVENLTEKSVSNNHIIIMIHLFDAKDGAGFEVFLNLDPYRKVHKNDDPKDGTLNSMKVFPKTRAGVDALFSECEEKILRAKAEGHNYPYNEGQRMKNAGLSNDGPGRSI